MAKDIKLYKDGNEVVINETQLDNFLDTHSVRGRAHVPRREQD